MTEDGLELGDAYLVLCDLLAGRTLPSAWGEVSEGFWTYLAQLAVAEGVGPLLYSYLKKYTCLEAVPEPARQALSGAYYATAGRNQMLLRELQRLLIALQVAQVPVLVYKGGALALNLYPEPALRPMSDLDLLVPPEHLERALHALCAIGYQQQKVSYHVVLQECSTPPVQVELHWSLSPESAGKPSPVQEWFWQHRQPYPLAVEGLGQVGSGAGSADLSLAYTLSPTAHLLVLAAHLVFQHGSVSGASPRLLWYYDLHLLLRKAAHYARTAGKEIALQRALAMTGAAVDWLALIDQARRLGWSATLYQALLETRTLFDSPIPEDFLAILEADAMSHQPASLISPNTRQKHWTSRALADLPWRARLRLLWGLAFPAPEYLRWRYQPRPPWLWPAWYPIRWWKLATHA